MLLALLVDEGKLSWDSPVNRIYPEFKLGDPEATARVLVRHLVCACTGLPARDWKFFFEFGATRPKDVFGELARSRLTTAFGETYQYSNLLATAAGFVGGYVAYPGRELGAAYDAAMHERIFEPLAGARPPSTSLPC